LIQVKGIFARSRRADRRACPRRPPRPPCAQGARSSAGGFAPGRKSEA